MADKPEAGSMEQEAGKNTNKAKFQKWLWWGLGVIVVAGIAGGAWWVGMNMSLILGNTTENKNITPVSSTTTDGTSAVDSSKADPTADWKTYTNTDYGFSFKYPKEYGDFSMSISSGTTGKNLYGKFSSYPNLVIGADTLDYSMPRGGGPLDFMGYVKDGSKYYSVPGTFKGDKSEIKVVDEAISPTGHEFILIKDDPSAEIKQIGSDSDGLLAYTNLEKSSIFKGLAIEVYASNSTLTSKKALAKDKFVQFLSTFTFTK